MWYLHLLHVCRSIAPYKVLMEHALEVNESTSEVSALQKGLNMTILPSSSGL